MSEKTYHSNPSNISYAENPPICCSSCKIKSKTMYDLCKSGHHITSMCAVCDSDTRKMRNNNGNCIYGNVSNRSGTNEISNIYNSKSQLQNLASGDHIKAIDSFAFTASKTEVTRNMDQNGTNYFETIVTYINDNYNKSHLSNDTSNEHFCELIRDQNIEQNIRPLKCPVTRCAKIVTAESFSHHFHFDHSKVPRMILKKTEPQELLMTYTTLSHETKCLALLQLSLKERFCVDKNGTLLFLMTAKLAVPPVKYPNTQSTIIENRYEQTGNLQNKDKSNQLSHDDSSWRNINEFSHDHHEVFLVWLCSLGNQNRTFNITVSSINKKQGYSYIGNAVHIREQQDPYSIYNSANCLSLRKTAVNKIASENELKVSVYT